MKTFNLLAVGFLILTLGSCKKSETSVTSKNDSLKVKNDTLVQNDLHKELYGLYTGDFIGKEMVKDWDGEYEQDVSKKITLKINRITKDSVYGQSVVAGNQRLFRGVFDENAKSFVLDEPGNDQTDGRFEVKIVADSLTGKWMAYKKDAVKSPNKSLKLSKKTFAYNPNFMLDKDSDIVDWENPKDFAEKYTDDETGKTEKYTIEKNRVASDAIFKINASKQALTENQLKNLRKLDLEIIKNAVFARHGYSFKKKTFRNFFETTDWYVPVSNNVDADLSPMEKENVALLNRFTKYAEDKYDSFGR